MLPGEARGQIVTYEGKSDFAENTIQAAALMTCGVPIRTFKSPRERTGEVEWRFEFLPNAPVQCSGNTAAEFKLFEQSFSGAALTANQLMHVYKFGLLEEADPAHPFLDAVRALRNRERFLRWIMSGQPCQLVKHARCDRWQYESAPLVELPSHMLAKDNPPTTRELKTVCALGVFGLPVVRCFGVLPDMTFELAVTGFAGAAAPPQSPQLARDFLDGSLDRLDPHHPYFIAYSAIDSIQKLKRCMHDEIANIWLEKPRSRNGVSAFLRADATSKARDTVHKHFKRGD